MTELTATTDVTRKPWPDLSAYGLKLFLLRGPDRSVHLLAGGRTDENAVALATYGMRQHPKNGRWHLSYKAGERMSFASLRDAFPLMQVTPTDPSTFLLPVTRQTTQMEVSASAVPESAAVETAADAMDASAESTPTVTVAAPFAIALPSAQRGKSERDAAKLLAMLGLTERIVQIDDSKNVSFYATVRNQPFQDLVIERQPYPDEDADGRVGATTQRIMLTHYRRLNGDSILDAEAVFRVNGQDGTLALIETAVENPIRGGELRVRDREFGALFLRNLLSQGFGTGALVIHNDADEPESAVAVETRADEALDATEDLPDDLAALAGIEPDAADDAATPLTIPEIASDTTLPSDAPAADSEPTDEPDADLASIESVDPEDYASAILDVPQVGRANYRVKDPSTQLRQQWSDQSAVEANLKALRILRAIEQAGPDSEPTEEDLDALIGYVGWGGLPGVFLDGHALHKRYNAQLQRLTDDAGYAAMRASTVNAHYTNHLVVDALWQSAIKAGFKGGRVLEPGAGTGLFMACLPESLSATTQFVAVEKDATSASILQALYPRAKVFATSYEQTAIPDNTVDLVIGNVPFGNFKIFDPAYQRLDAYIHDYFLVKSLDKLRPGGTLICITGTGTLDRHNPKVREVMQQQADLMAAFRLPEDAFKANANTKVTTDIIVLRKRLPGESPREFTWRDRVAIDGADGEPVTMNAVYTTPAAHVLGHLVTSNNMYGGARNTVTRFAPRGGATQSLAGWIATIPEAMPADFHAPMTATQLAGSDEVSQQDTSQFFDPKAEGAFVLIGNQHVGVVLHGKPVQVTGLLSKDVQRIRDYIPLRDAVAATIQAQLDGCDDAALAAAQASLGGAYGAFVKAHGRIAEGRRNKNRALLEDDPIFDAVHALEILDDENRCVALAEMFTARTVGPRTVIRCNSAHDALIACIDQKGEVDPEWISKHAERPWGQCVMDLNKQIYRDPTSGKWELAARYLSGNVRVKLRIAEAAVASDPTLAGNVDALTARLPQWLTSDEITVSLGMRWIDPRIIEEFLHHVYGTSHLTTSFGAALSAATSTWVVEGPKFVRSETWDTPRMKAMEMIEAALNGKTAKVTKAVDGDSSKRVVDEVATAIAMERQRGLRDLFATWVWTDVDRTKQLETIYNETFNAIRSADYAGLAITVAGMSTSRKLREHQQKGLARSLLEDNVALAHPVGFGKTATMAATAMKLRQVFGGKSVICTPKNVVSQFAGEAKRWFPTARVLVMKSDDLTPKGRGRFWRRVQVTNPDLIVTTPEAFKRLRLPKDAEVRFLMDEIAQFEAVMSATQAEGGTARRIKQMESALAGKCAQLSKLMNISEKDDNRVTLADLGITTLMIDEAHRYKNLRVESSEQILGIPSAASQRAFDMLSKVRYTQEQGGKVIFATGSLITNTIAEVYNVQRYLQPKLLEETGLMNFDAWRSQFADTVQSLEPDPAGKGYRIVSRLAEIRNVPELVRMLAQVVDAVPDTNAYFERPTPTFHTVSIEPTELQVRMREALAERVQLIREDKSPPAKGKDNILCVLGDARRGALDVRTLYPALPEDVGGAKIGEVAAKVAEIYMATTADRGAQAIFLDMGTPKPVSAGSFSAYDALTARLERLGVDREHIAYIHDAKSDPDKLALYRRVREGSIRVLIGSTEKMGEGANVQDRLKALHHLNAPYHPGAVTQRNGRVIRNGNMYPNVDIYTYVTKGMLEDWNWHLVTLKAGFIGQVMDGMASGNDGAGIARKIVEDKGAMSFEEIEAEASDNPLVRRKCVVDTRVRELDLLRSAWGQQRGSHNARIQMCDGSIARNNARATMLDGLVKLVDDSLQTREQRHLAAKKTNVDSDALVALGVNIQSDSATTAAVKSPATNANDPFGASVERELSAAFVMTVGSKSYASRKDAGNALLLAAHAATKESYKSAHVLGEIDGLSVVLRTSFNAPPFFALTPPSQTSLLAIDAIDVSIDPLGMVRRIENGITRIRQDAVSARDMVVRNQSEIDGIRAVMAQAWSHEAEFAELRREQGEINIELAQTNHSAVGSGIAGFAEALARYDIDMKRKVEALDDFDVAKALADLGELEALPESENDDEDEVAGADANNANRRPGTASRLG